MRQQIGPGASTMLLACSLLALAGCNTNISYRPLPNVHVSTPVSIPYPGTARLPGGYGGTKKTGKPYRVGGHTYYPLSSAAGYDRTGIASWYGRKFHGRRTANGERYDMHALSAAHTVLPLPTLVRVTNLENGRQVVVRVNDRGPYAKNRLIDLSYAAALQLGFANKGTARVRVQVLEGSPPAMLTGASERRQVQVRPARTTTSGVMYVQLGAFLSQTNAERLRSSLLREHPNTQVRSYNHSSQTLYRVRIGPFSEPEKIEQAVLSLKDSGFDNVIVVIE